ncbi:MAG: hypothetical protein DI565_13520 [Ancylobacter novellus]|uniref:Uncharacterized protein n=1 Tax=Ancylobacter novellus TaxID=921 RepID=A0A2W5K8U4_ANCNO|nr:MAG: hypothetical protein DI565_13520 [Ancylobacter novellus]
MEFEPHTIALAAALAAAFAAFLAVVAANRKERARRLKTLDDCGALLEAARPGRAPSGYGVLRGHFAGRPAALTPIAEAMAFRRLPQLWIAAALRAGPFEGSLEILRRPTGAEFYAGGDGLPLRLPPPPSWPRDARVKCDRAGAALAPRLERLLAEAFTDPRVKAVGVGPGGVRVVRQAAQGDAGAYRIFRDSRFASPRVAPEAAQAALTLAQAVAEALEQDEAHVAEAA